MPGRDGASRSRWRDAEQAGGAVRRVLRTLRLPPRSGQGRKISAKERARTELTCLGGVRQVGAAGGDPAGRRPRRPGDGRGAADAAADAGHRRPGCVQPRLPPGGAHAPVRACAHLCLGSQAAAPYLQPAVTCRALPQAVLVRCRGPPVVVSTGKCRVPAQAPRQPMQGLSHNVGQSHEPLPETRTC